MDVKAVFPGERNAAMQLDAFTGDPLRRIGTIRLGDMGMVVDLFSGRSILTSLAKTIVQCSGIFDTRAHGLQPDLAVGHDVLERLECTDDLAELLPLFQVVDCLFETIFRSTEQFCGRQDSENIVDALGDDLVVRNLTGYLQFRDRLAKVDAVGLAQL